MSNLNNELGFLEMIHTHLRTVIIIYKIICTKINSFIDLIVFLKEVTKNRNNPSDTFKLPCMTLQLYSYSPSFHGIQQTTLFKHQSYYYFI
jgi:hypothetical protein